VKPGDQLAILTAGAYGMVMSSNYNARPRPPEIVIAQDGKSWDIARRRETWEDLIRLEG
jgi:diaminopimelate decarboxylase